MFMINTHCQLVDGKDVSICEKTKQYINNLFDKRKIQYVRIKMASLYSLKGLFSIKINCVWTCQKHIKSKDFLTVLLNKETMII